MMIPFLPLIARAAVIASAAVAVSTVEYVCNAMSDKRPNPSARRDASSVGGPRPSK